MSETPETGDRPLQPGSPPTLIDMSQQPETPAPQGDRQVPGIVILVRDDQRPTPTAGDYRAAGYGVPDPGTGPVPDDQVPGLVYADRHVPGVVSLATPPLEPGPGPEPEPSADSETEEGTEEPGPEEPSKEEPAEEKQAEEKPAEREQAEEKPSAEERSETRAERDGCEARREGKARTDNPHDRRTTEGKAWDRGWSETKPDA